MFGGVGADGNPVFPGFVDENRTPFDHNALSQLQLFGHAPSHCAGAPNIVSNLPASGLNVAVKRGGDRVPVCTKQKLHISSNKNSVPGEFGPFGGMQPNPNSVSTGLRLSFEEEEHNSSVTSASENMKLAVSGIPGGCLKAVIDQQTEELERYIKHQEGNFLKGMAELNQRHTISLLNALEKGLARKLHEKALELDTINRKNQELGDKIKQVSMEAQSWQYRAKYSESMVNVLKSNIQQLMAQGTPCAAREGSGDSEVDDAVSGTNVESGGLGRDRRLMCRSCKSKEVCFLLLPCRHLCLCGDCEGFSGVCPVCRVMKTASVHVYM